MKFLPFLFLFFALSVIIALNSCKKDRAVQDNDILSVTDYAKASEAGMEVFNVTNDYGINVNGIKGEQWDSTVQVTVSPMYPLDSFPKTMIVNFGQTGIICNDGHIRKGVLTAVFSGKWTPDSALAGSTATVTFNNYYVDGVKRLGTYVITYNGKPTSGPSYTVSASNAKLIFQNSDEISWNSVRTTEWYGGFDTYMNQADDVFYTTGTATGINREGQGYTATIIQALKTDMSCVTESYQRGTITQGVFELVPDGLSKRTVDYGSGTCDRAAVVSFNGFSLNINF